LTVGNGKLKLPIFLLNKRRICTAKLYNETEQKKGDRQVYGFFKAMIEFMSIMLTKFRSVPRLWLIALAAVNMTSLYFIDSTEARVVFGVFVISMIIMTGIYYRWGFVRMLGLGHILWIPMVLWLLTRLYQTLPLNSTLEYWLLMVIVINTISLLIDAVDVIRYIKGERSPYYKLPE
jgi:hypothetical protein